MCDIKSNSYLTKELLTSDFLKKNFLIEKYDMNDTSESINLVIEGDNISALRKFIPSLSGKANIIYLDPEYNNKNAKLSYSTGRIPHEYWMNNFRDRVELSIELLNKNDGLLAISIDDYEYHRVRLLLDDYFDESEIKTIVVKVAEPTGNKMVHVKNKGSIAKLKEYLILAKKNGAINFLLDKVPKNAWDTNYKYFIDNVTKNDIYILKSIMLSYDRTNDALRTADAICNKFKLTTIDKKLKSLNITKPKEIDSWKYENSWRIVRTCSTNTNIKELADRKKQSTKLPFFTVVSPQNKMHLIKSNYNSNDKEPRIKLLFADDHLFKHLGDIWDDIKTTGLSREGGIEFKYGKKPLKLLKRIISLADKDNLLVVDMYGGSGTTGQAILELNQSDGGHRNFILVEHKPFICEPITYKRLMNSLQGINNCEKTHGNILYCKLPNTY